MKHKFLLAGLFIFCLTSCSKSEGIWEEFEDPIFITYLHDHCDIPITEKGRIDMNDEATLRALGKITDLNLNGVGCFNLAGINNLVSLVDLSCNRNRLTSLDVSLLDNLQTLSCRSNNLKTINVKGCVELLDFLCSDNQIETLDIKEHTSLRTLSCWENRLNKIDVRGCNSLKYLDCKDQTDDKNKIRKPTLIMSPDLQKVWENTWKELNPNAIAIFKE